MIFTRLFELVGWVFALNQEAFQVVSILPDGVAIALFVVFLAGLSKGVGQAVILFVNQVTPIRFVLSLVVNAVLFTGGVIALVLSTWLITLVPGTASVPLTILMSAFGISYAPFIFSFLGAMPHLGLPLLSLLSVWHLLAIVIGFAAVADVSVNLAFCYVALGWVMQQVLQSTVGQPIANLGSRVANAIAGVELITRQRKVAKRVSDRLDDAPVAWAEEFRQRISEVRQQQISSSRGRSEMGAMGRTGASATSESATKAPSTSAATEDGFKADEQDGSGAAASQPSSFFDPSPGSSADWAFGSSFGPLPDPESSISSPQRPPVRRWQQALKTGLALGSMALLTAIVIIFLRPVRVWLFSWYDQLPSLFRFVFNLAWIGVIGVAVGGLLAPLETLGWWAGWYEDRIDSTLNAGDLAPSAAKSTPRRSEQSFSRYIVYLDGIGQSTFEYLPDTEEFLDTLAHALPADVALIRGIIPYSVLNNPLDEDRPLAFLWKAVDRARLGNPATLLGLLINLRNTLIVAVSADKRYGPLYNQGIAQIVYNGLLKNGYCPETRTPITLIGFSGGGQMACAAAPLLKQTLSTSIDVISIAGVISGNCNVLQLEHLYHLVGDNDPVERLGPIMFPGRWKLLTLSYWNRAKRRGKISVFSMGPVGHQVPGGILDPNVTLADGRSALQQTLDYVNQILTGTLLPQPDLDSIKPSNYQRYREAAFVCPDYYPAVSAPPGDRYQPLADWMGRLILPLQSQRSTIQGVLLELYHTPPEHRRWVGQVVVVRWSDDPLVKRWVQTVTKDVHFSADASYTSQFGGLVHPDRLNHWQQVDPLESLAGSHPVDDVVVALDGPVEIEPHTTDREYQIRSRLRLHPPKSDSPSISPDLLVGVDLRIHHQPMQITGRYYGLVKFISPLEGDRYRVVHFNSETRRFDGVAETVSLPPVIPDENGCVPSTANQIERSPLNESGWYIYGALDRTNQFVVQALAPRALMRLQPDSVLFGGSATYRHLRQETWDDLKAKKGKTSSVLCAATASSPTDPNQKAIDQWQEGDRALVLHVYGGIGGNKREPAATTPIFFGHFAFGVAAVVREPLTRELCFDIRYQQVYTHNTDGLIAGSLHWSRYMGDRQFGWAGVRPTCDILIKLDSFTAPYTLQGIPELGPYGRRPGKPTPLAHMMTHLDAMTARYRIGDGTGGTYVGPANNCAQDSNQALFASLIDITESLQAASNPIQDLADRHPEEQHRLQQLRQLGQDLKRELQPWGKVRRDWATYEFNLGSTLEDEPLRNLMMGLSSWKTLLPRKASDTIAHVFLDYGASLWVLRTNQIGGVDPDIEPIAPITL